MLEIDLEKHKFKRLKATELRSEIFLNAWTCRKLL